jgi:hypothetical protein
LHGEREEFTVQVEIYGFASNRLCVIGSGESLSPNPMRFRLLFSGELKAHRLAKPRPEHTHSVRVAFSPQLQRLWETKESLRRWSAVSGARARARRGETFPEGQLFDEPNRIEGLEYFANLNRKLNTRFIPLLSPPMAVRCRIDILFLRPEDTLQHIIQGGDLDNRVKTLFDALRVPKNDELVDDGRTHYVLLQDDSLISEVSIVGDNLLSLPSKPVLGSNDAFLVIDVQLDTLKMGRSSEQDLLF